MTEIAPKNTVTLVTTDGKEVHVEIGKLTHTVTVSEPVHAPAIFVGENTKIPDRCFGAANPSKRITRKFKRVGETKRYEQISEKVTG